MCNQTCFSVDTFTFLYDDDDDDDDDNDDEHYPILTHKNPYMGKVLMGIWASAVMMMMMMMLPSLHSLLAIVSLLRKALLHILQRGKREHQH